MVKVEVLGVVAVLGILGVSGGVVFTSWIIDVVCGGG